MRIAFVSFHCRYHYQTIAGPFLQAAVSAQLPGTEWRTFEFQTSTPVATAFSQLLDYKPDVVAFSAYLWSIEIHTHLAAQLQSALPNAVRILGGPEAWLAVEAPDHALLSPFDAVVIGEAEIAFPAVLDRISQSKMFERIIETEPITDLDALPSPYQMGLFREDTPYLHMETSRGCVNHCSFCTSSHSPTRLYAIDRWHADLEAVLSRFKNLHRINLLDRSLNESADRMVSVIDTFLQNSNAQILHIEMHPDFIDDEQLAYLHSLPPSRLHVEMGIQSFDKKTLASVGRKTDPAHVTQVVETVAGFDSVSLHVDLIAGLPSQKHADIRGAVEKLCSLDPDDIQLERLKMLPGTPVRKNRSDSISFSPSPPWEVIETTDYTAAKLAEADALSRLLDRYYNSSYFRRTLKKMISELGSWNRLWDLLGEKDDTKKPTSVVERFQFLKAVIEEQNLSSPVKEQWLFDLFLHGRYRSESRTVSEPDYSKRLKAALKIQPQKEKSHIERFEHAIDGLTDFHTPGSLLFIYQGGQVMIYGVNEATQPVQVWPLAIATKGKLESVQEVR